MPTTESGKTIDVTTLIDRPTLPAGLNPEDALVRAARAFRRERVLIAAIAAGIAILFVVGAITIGILASRQASIRHTTEMNERLLLHNQALTEAYVNAAFAEFSQTACRVTTLGTLDTKWREALNAVLDDYISGDIPGAQAALPALDAAAQIDIPATLMAACP